MEKRIIQVEIETIDEKHCSEDCVLMKYETMLPDSHYCCATSDDLYQDKIGYLRTKTCIKNDAVICKNCGRIHDENGIHERETDKKSIMYIKIKGE